MDNDGSNVSRDSNKLSISMNETTSAVAVNDNKNDGSSINVDELKNQFFEQLDNLQGTLVSLHGVSKWIFSKHVDSPSLIVSFWKEYFNDCYFIIKDNDHSNDSNSMFMFKSLSSSNKISHLLNLIYLASDILQSSIKITNSSFPDLFAPIIGDCLNKFNKVGPPDLQIKTKKLLNVWRERKVFTSEVIDKIGTEMVDGASIDSNVTNININLNYFEKKSSSSSLRPKRDTSNGSSSSSTPRERSSLIILEEHQKNPVPTYDNLESSAIPDHYYDLLDKMEQFDTDSILGDLLSDRLGNSVSSLEYFIKSQFREENKHIRTLSSKQIEVLENAKLDISKFSHFQSRTKGEDIVTVEEASLALAQSANIEINDENQPNLKKRKRDTNPYELIEAVEHVKLPRKEIMALITERKKRANKGVDTCNVILHGMKKIEEEIKDSLDLLPEKNSLVSKNINKYGNILSSLKILLKKVLAASQPKVIETVKDTQLQETTKTQQIESNQTNYPQPVIGWATPSSLSSISTSASSYGGGSTWGATSSNSWYTNPSISTWNTSSTPAASASSSSSYPYSQNYGYGTSGWGTTPTPNLPPTYATSQPNSWSLPTNSNQGWSSYNGSLSSSMPLNSTSTSTTASSASLSNPYQNQQYPTQTYQQYGTQYPNQYSNQYSNQYPNQYSSTTSTTSTTTPSSSQSQSQYIQQQQNWKYNNNNNSSTSGR